MRTYVDKCNKAIICFLLVSFIAMLIPSGVMNVTSALAKAGAFREEKVTFVSGKGEFEEVIEGTILIPTHKASTYPGIVLAHGSGINKEGGGGNQTALRKEAEVFAKEGLITLVYNKRSKGYSKTNRSYDLLAQDLLAGVHALQERSDVMKNKVGVWGISEGGWVAPIAASQSTDIAFVITSGAPGISPIQQQTWNVENRLRHQGVTNPTPIQALVRNGAGVMLSLSSSEADMYDPVPILKKVHQPFLAIWGSIDRQVPPAESAQILKDAFDSSGNRHYTLQFIEGADHSIYNNTDDGFRTLKTLYPGYAEAMASWLKQVVEDQPPVAQTIGKTPVQMSSSPKEVAKIDWYDLYWVHLGVSAILLIICLTAIIVSLVKKIRSHQPLFINGYTNWICLSAMISITGFWAYLVTLWMNGGRNIGLVVFGTPLLWLLIQIVSTVTVVLTLLSIVRVIRKREGQQRGKMEIIVIGAGIVYIPWALYWHLCFI